MRPNRSDRQSTEFRTGLRPIREPLSRVMEEIARKVAERPQPPSERHAA